MDAPILERNCMEGLLWRWLIPEEIPVTTLRSGLRDCGYYDNSQFDWVWEFHHPQEHKVVIVPTTRRLQIRINYMTPRDQRPTAAWSIALAIHQICEGNLSHQNNHEATR